MAIKILHERLSSDPEMDRLFRREALLANQIGHAGVVPVIDDDVSDEGYTFLVMPLLRGETARARAERLGGQLPLEEVLVIGRAVLETLSAAHAKKIDHRDIKPENIFVPASGEAKTLDFGVGGFFQSEEAAATRSGRALGTPAFMASEQALGRTREIDGRTDLWAVGATMFTLLSGHLVHDAETAAELLVMAATRPARRLREAAPGVPVAIQEVVDKALAFAKDDRWPNAAAMMAALSSASEVGLGRALSSLPPIAGRASGSEAGSQARRETNLAPVATERLDEIGNRHPVGGSLVRLPGTRTGTLHPTHGQWVESSMRSDNPPPRRQFVSVVAGVTLSLLGIALAGLAASGAITMVRPRRSAMDSSAPFETRREATTPTEPRPTESSHDAGDYGATRDAGTRP